MKLFKDLIAPLNGNEIQVYQDLTELKYYHHQGWDFTWITIEPCLSQHSQIYHHKLGNQANQETVLWVVDGIIEVNLGLNLEDFQETNYKLNQGELMILTGLHHYQIKTRSAWAAQILLISRSAESELTPRVQVIHKSQIFSVGQYGVWRSFSKYVREILAIDRLSLIVGQPGFSWLGANYLGQANFRVILIEFPEGRKALNYPEIGLLPGFRNQSENDLIFIGLEGFIQLRVNSNSRQWLTAGKIITLEPGQRIFFEDQGHEVIKFLVLSTQSEGPLANHLHLDQKVLELLTQVQGPFWSRLSWPLLSNLKFEN